MVVIMLRAVVPFCGPFPLPSARWEIEGQEKDAVDGVGNSLTRAIIIPGLPGTLVGPEQDFSIESP